MKNRPSQRTEAHVYVYGVYMYMLCCVEFGGHTNAHTHTHTKWDTHTFSPTIFEAEVGKSV